MNLQTFTVCSILLFVACGSEAQTRDAPNNNAASLTGSTGVQQGLLTMPNDSFSALPAKNATRTAFFGDLHVHTTYSLDTICKN